MWAKLAPHNQFVLWVQAKAQVVEMGRWFGFSFLWSAVKWATNFEGNNCFVAGSGQALSHLMGPMAPYLNIQFTLVGSGMLCPHIVNWYVNENMRKLCNFKKLLVCLPGKFPWKP